MVDSPFTAPSDQHLRVSVVLGAATFLYLGYHLAISRPFVTRVFPTRTTTDAELRVHQGGQRNRRRADVRHVDTE